MAKFLSDVNMKHNGKPNGDSLLDDTDEEDDHNAIESKHKSKPAKREKESKIDDNGDSGLDNGVQLSE